MLIRFLQLLIGLSVVTALQAQIREDFSDREFINDPTWIGDQNLFEVNQYKELHLIDSVERSSQLVTSSSIFDKVIWEFYVRMDFNPSSSNLAKVYLMSDQEDLQGMLNGYYVLIGDSEDEISLYKQEGGSSTYVINGDDDVVDVSSPEVRIKVIRDQNGRWSLYHDLFGGWQYEFAGSAIDDDPDIISTDYFGLICQYTSTRADKFYFDDIVVDQLRIDSIQVQNDTSIHVFLNQYVLEPDISNLADFSITDLTISNIEFAENDSSILAVDLDPSMPLQTGNYQFGISADVTLNEAEQFSFDFTRLALDTLLTVSESEILLDFNQVLDPTSAENTTNYWIDQGIGNPSIVTVNPDDNSQVHLVLDDVLVSAVEYQIDITEILNQSLNSHLSGSENFSFVVPLLIDSVKVLSQDSLQVYFNKTLDPVTATNTDNYELTLGMGTPMNASLSPDEASVILVFEQTLEENYYELGVDGVTDAEGLSMASGNIIGFEYFKLWAFQIWQTDFETINVQFNQKPGQSAEVIEHYHIPGIGSPSAAAITLENDSIVQLTFPNLYNSDYLLVIDGIENLEQNAITERDTLAFKFEKPTDWRAIQINEIMADFSPSVGLPEAEYIELYNPGNYSLQLENFYLNGEPIPAYQLEAGAYLVVTDDSNIGLFGGEVIYLSSFNQLTNSGELVLLQDQFGNEVDSLLYTLEWYQDSDKDDGGYSLEQINAQLNCSDETNWSASLALSGGTPGSINSIANTELDVVGPLISELEVISGDTLSITFNEPLLAETLNPGRIASPSFEISRIDQYSYRNFRLILDVNLTSEEQHYLTVSEISDCQGNMTDLDSISFYHDATPPYLEDLIVVSDKEIALVFNEPLNETIAENEENYNLFETLGTPTKSILQDSTKHRVQLSWDTVLLESESYQLISANLTDTLDNKMDSAFLSFDFRDQVDSVYAVAPNLIYLLLDEVPVTPMSPGSFLMNKDIGNPSKVEVDPDNSKLIRLGFDKNLTSNSDYTLYIHGIISSETHERLITPSHVINYDTRAPRIEELIIPGDSQLIIVWDEDIQLSSAFSSIQYEVTGFGNPMDISAINQQRIQLTFDFLFPKEEALNLRVNGVGDLAGNKGGNINKGFYYDPLPPILEKILVIEENILSLTFSEKLDTASAFKPEHYLIEDQTPQSIYISGPDSLQVHLEFLPLPIGENEVIMVFDLQDQHGNFMDSSGFYFNSKHPIASELVFTSDSSLVITFSKEMSESLAVKGNYLINDATPDSIQHLNSLEIRVFLKEKVSQLDTLNIEFLGLKDTDGDPVIENHYEVVYDSYFKHWKSVDEKSIQLDFETLFAEISSDQFSLDDMPSVLAQLDGEEKGIVRLVFADTIAPNEPHILIWRNLVDKYGRRIPDQKLPIFLDRKAPELLSIESDFHNQIQLTFSESLSDESKSLNHYDLLGRPKLEEVLQPEDSIIILSFDELLDGSVYDLVMGGISDNSGNITLKDTIQFQYQLPYLPQEGEIIITELMIDPTPAIGLLETEYIEIYNAGDNTINLNSLILSDASRQVSLPAFDLLPDAYAILSEEAFTGAIYISGFPSLDNSADSISLFNIYGDLIDQVVYQRDWYGNTEKDDGGYSLEIINPFSTCPGSANWIASEHPDGGTPGAINSVFNLTPDNEPPILLNHSLDGPEITLVFSETMDSLSLAEGDYQIDGFSIGEIAVSGTDQLKVFLNNEPTPGILYQMSVEGPEDCSGNLIEAFEISFGNGRTPVFNEIVISEIMADPDPVIGLPNAEYLEIYNTTGDLLSLENVSIVDQGVSVELPAAVLSAHQYLILVPTSAVNLFTGVDPVVGLSGWRSLSNQGESLALYHNEDLLFHVAYEDNWYDGETDGGVALEIKDVTNPCVGGVNWGSSINTQGGTPGSQNSIMTSIPDNFGPELLGLEIITDQELRLNLSEQLSPDEIEGNQFQIDPGAITISGFTMDDLNRDFITLELGESLQPNIEYTITVNGLDDCLGNPITENTLKFYLPETADSLDVVINEVLFNPKDDGVDFVEIYNRSNKNINLKNWVLAREMDGAMDQYQIAENDFLIHSGEFLALTPDKPRLELDYPKANSERLLQMSRFPVLPNQTKKIVLLNEEGQKIDAFEYDEDMHLPFLESVEGVSLERIAFDQPTQDRNNWQSASSTVGFATPGYENSQSMETIAVTGTIDIEPKVFVPANHGSVVAQDFTTINYQLTTTGSLANVNIYNRNGQLIRNLANGATLATSGFLRWDGSTDNGSIASMGYYLIVFEVYDPQGNREIIKETVVVGR